MKKKTILNFEEINVEASFIEGKYWVAIKPLCQALEVDYETFMKMNF